MRLLAVECRLDADPDSQLPDLLDFEDRVLDEDLLVLEAFDDMALSTDAWSEVSVRSDRLSMAYRPVLGELADEHARLSAPSAAGARTDAGVAR